jgi:hypothetical protein
MTSRPSATAPVLAALAIVLVPLGAYVAGYLCLGEQTNQLHSGGGNPTGAMTILRTYSHQWQVVVFQPAATMESLLRGGEVRAHYVLPRGAP